MDICIFVSWKRNQFEMSLDKWTHAEIRFRKRQKWRRNSDFGNTANGNSISVSIIRSKDSKTYSRACFIWRQNYRQKDCNWNVHWCKSSGNGKKMWVSQVVWYKEGIRFHQVAWWEWRNICAPDSDKVGRFPFTRAEWRGRVRCWNRRYRQKESR